jgi:hypothetical protein
LPWNRDIPGLLGWRGIFHRLPERVEILLGNRPAGIVHELRGRIVLGPQRPTIEDIDEIRSPPSQVLWP